LISWNTSKEKYSIGDIIKEGVISITSYTIFVELENKMDRLLHITDMT